MSWSFPGGYKYQVKQKTPVVMVFHTHTIHVWYIYLHLPYFAIKNNENMKCRCIYIYIYTIHGSYGITTPPFWIFSTLVDLQGGYHCSQWWWADWEDDHRSLWKGVVQLVGGEKWRTNTLPETNSSPLKMDGWNTTFLLGRPIFRCYVSFREGTIWRQIAGSVMMVGVADFRSLTN